MKQPKKIEPKEWYNLEDVKTAKVFSWCRSPWAIRKVVERDAKSTKILQPIITGNGRGKKYHFLGANLLKFIKTVETGKVRL